MENNAIIARPLNFDAPQRSGQERPDFPKFPRLL
jgi:hypothetical protein